MSKRLNDTEALARQGIKRAGMELAERRNSSGFYPSCQPAYGSADRAVSGPRPGQFQRETGAGNESLAQAVKIAKEC